jgi:hypothetical protein
MADGVVPAGSPGLRQRLPHGPRAATRDEAARLIRADFAEMPDLTVTVSQAARFWGLHPDLCREALGRLTRDGYLAHVGGRFRRATFT